VAKQRRMFTAGKQQVNDRWDIGEVKRKQNKQVYRER